MCKQSRSLEQFVVKKNTCKSGCTTSRQCRECRKEVRKENRRLKVEASGRKYVFLRRVDRESAEIACSKCKRIQPRNQFPPSGLNKGSYWCRECRKGQKARQRQRNAEKAGRKYVSQEVYCEQKRIARERQRAERQDRYKRLLVEQWERREHVRNSKQLLCYVCKETKDRSAFHPSMTTTRSETVCKDCVSRRDREKFERDRYFLSDYYIKRQLTKRSKLGVRSIPPVMIEAKRVQLMLKREILGVCFPRPETPTNTSKPSRSERYATWLSGVLRNGPVDAEILNGLSLSAGFGRKQMDKLPLRVVRRDVATYDQTTRTWRAR